MRTVFALIKERKNPPDRRVVFSPDLCVELKKQFPDAAVIVESSPRRVFPDEAYRQAGIDVVTDIAHADVLLGVKEVPVEALIPGKKYFFFSHTIKKQPYNRDLLRKILDSGIELYDHEVIVDRNDSRLIGFGYYAGVVGAYNGFRMLGLRDGLFRLPKMEDLHDLKEAKSELDALSLPPVKIVLTGSLTGKVVQGAKEILDHLKITELPVEEFLSRPQFDRPVYCVAGVADYNRFKDGRAFDKGEFYTNPQNFESDFMKFAATSDMLIAGHFYGEGAPFLFTAADTRRPDFRISLVADISCDIDGPVASTIRASTIADPFYGYDRQTGRETEFDARGAIAVMAVDNLPCELPRDASTGFGTEFLEKVIPAFFNGDRDEILARAQITTSCGSLTPRFEFLQDYADGRE